MGDFFRKQDEGRGSISRPSQRLSVSPSSDRDNFSHQVVNIDSTDKLDDDEMGSGWIGAALNLSNSIVGAGCIGLAGAIANSGGVVSFFAISIFAVLSKFSLDLVVELAQEIEDDDASTYEGLGFVTYGIQGKMTVVIAKGLYSFGCLVAYIVIVKDNFASALSHLLYGYGNQGEENEVPADTTEHFFSNQYFVTIFFCSSIMMPLCLLRDVSPLERFSAMKIAVVMLIVVIVMHLFFTDRNAKQESNFANHWLVVHDGIVESLGTFVFTFVAQHTVHLVFQSLKPSQQKYFPRTSTLGTVLSTLISMSIGFFVYMTFWEETNSAMFDLYLPSKAVDLCRILLCISMLLTYPFPFLTVRELLVLIFFTGKYGHKSDPQPNNERKPLVGSSIIDDRESWLLPGSTRQLKWNYHAGLTIFIFLVTLILALGASNLGIVLNLTGCATGTVISYVLPSLFSYKLRGHTLLGTLLLMLGGTVGIVGTYYSLLAIFQ